MPRQTIAQLGEAADVTQRAVRQAAACIHCGNRTVLTAGRIQALAHVGQIVIRRSGQQLAGGIHNAPAVDLPNHRFSVVELRNVVVQKLSQQFAFRERIQCLIGAVGDDHRALAVNRHVGRRHVTRQGVQHRALGVDRLIIAVLRLHERSAVREGTGFAVAALKRCRTVLLDIGIQTGIRISAQQQSVLKEADCARI